MFTGRMIYLCFATIHSAGSSVAFSVIISSLSSPCVAKFGLQFSFLLICGRGLHVTVENERRNIGKHLLGGKYDKGVGKRWEGTKGER